MKGRFISIAMLLVLSISAGIAVCAAELRAGNGSITATGVPAGGALVTALVRDGALLETKLQQGSETLAAVPADAFGGIMDTDTLQAFLWDMETLAPLCPALTTDYSGVKEADRKVTITIGESSFTAVLYENETAAAFQEMLPLTVTMNELNGNEKYFYFDQNLPTDSTQPETIHEGELMLYGSNCLVLFYDTFSSAYSYTKIGYMEDTAGLKRALGSGNVTVRYA